jgi:hypothetical protein
VQAAPAGLKAAITASAVKGTAISGTLTILIKGTMKTMTWLKLKFAIGTCAIAVLAGGGAIVAISQTNNNDKLTAGEIIQKSGDAYAALSSYSDEGTTVSTIGTTSVAPHIFAIKMARPNLYRVAWRQDSAFFSSTGMVWSAGNGDFQKTTTSSRQERNMEEAFSSAAGISGGASMSIPGAFFQINSGNPLGSARQAATRLPDAKIGGQDCYVLTRPSGERMKTLWIGKQDFLIHQIQNDTSAAGLKAAMEAEARKHPERPIPTAVAGDIQSIETHTNIVVNRPLVPKDFAP